MKTAIVLGATGLTGSLLLDQLIRDDQYSTIKVFTRSSVDVSSSKIKQYLVDLLALDDYQEMFTGDEVFCCVGSTKKKTPDEETYRKVDYGIPLAAAKLAKANGIKKILIVSALGADPRSRFFYNRTKGEMERDVLKIGIEETYFFEPSLIRGDRKEKRLLEDLGNKVMRVGNLILMGPLRKYRSIKAKEIAIAMVAVARKGYSEVRIPSEDIKQLAKES